MKKFDEEKENAKLNFASQRVQPIPVRFHRMITNFIETTMRGNVILKLSIISTISPQTRKSAHIRGTPETSITVIKARPTRMSDP